MEREGILDEVARRYALERGHALAGAHAAVVRNFLPDLSETETWTLEARIPDGPATRHYTERYVGSPADPAMPHAVRALVHIAEYPGPADTREGLLLALAQLMAPRLPNCAERGLAIGELCFCGLDDPPTRIYFVRGNVKVEVTSIGLTPVGVADLAGIVDRQLQASLKPPS
ncbi:MAG TPA: hypothetical protein VGB04_02650 [Allosphingosinicella sp.]|jgi:hypothetical protein